MSWTETQAFKESWKKSPIHIEWDPNKDHDTILVMDAISRSQERSIIMSLTPNDYYVGPEARYEPEAEPPPHLDYWSMNMVSDLRSVHMSSYCPFLTVSCCMDSPLSYRAKQEVLTFDGRR